MPSAPSLELLILFMIPLSIFLVGALWGRRVEKKHFAELGRRELLFADFPIHSWRKMPDGLDALRSDLVTGAVVISEDAGKRFLARLKNLRGGNIKSYETLLDRGRREACLRMLEQAKSQGADAIVNVRYETSDLTSQKDGQASPIGIEVMVFGTAVHLRKAQV
jgi:uncharacterized protein YbjQ (UPF0145 family)